jgi:hypothetical protein
MYSIVETEGNECAVVPAKWMVGATLFYPSKKNVVSLVKRAVEYEPTWPQYSAILVETGFGK